MENIKKIEDDLANMQAENAKLEAYISKHG
jgi:hypothetical protein